MFNGHFNLVLLALLMGCCLMFMVYTSHVHNDALTQWTQGITGQFLAALLALMVKNSSSTGGTGNG